MDVSWTDRVNSAFDRIYGIDLVYMRECWKLCGDAHCCSFHRYKSRFVFLGKKPFQELLLLPGEWDYLGARGLTSQFGDHEHKTYAFRVGSRYLRAETLLSRRPHCACDHDTRTTVCRLYPVLPVFDLEGHFVGTDRFGLFEDLEYIEGLEAACQIQAITQEQLGLLLAIVSELGRVPLFVFYASAYRLAKASLRDRLAQSKARRPAQSAFRHFENAYLRQQLFEEEALSAELEALRARFSQRYGRAFDDAIESASVPPPEAHLTTAPRAPETAARA